MVWGHTGAQIPSGSWISVQCNMIHPRPLPGGEDLPTSTRFVQILARIGSTAGRISTGLGKAGVDSDWQVP